MMHFVLVAAPHVDAKSPKPKSCQTATRAIARRGRRRPSFWRLRAEPARCACNAATSGSGSHLRRVSRIGRRGRRARAVRWGRRATYAKPLAARERYKFVDKRYIDDVFGATDARGAAGTRRNAITAVGP